MKKYGDGWISNSPAHFKMQNSCQGLIINWDPVLGSFYIRDTTVNIIEMFSFDRLIISIKIMIFGTLGAGLFIGIIVTLHG